MFVQRLSIVPVTASDGTATAYSSVFSGRIVGIRYVKASSGSFSDGIDFTATLDVTGESIMVGTDVNSSATYYPRVGVTDATGAAVTLDGTRLMRDCVYAAQDRVKIVIAQGGDTKTGTFYVLVQ